MKNSGYQPTDSIAGGLDANQEVAWVKITFDVAYCNWSSAKVKVRLHSEVLSEWVLEGEFHPGETSVSFEQLVYPRYVQKVEYQLDPLDWTVAIKNVTTEWSDAEQAPGEPPPPPPPPEPGVVTVPLTLLIPSIPEPPPDEDGLWPSISAWITEYWWAIAIGVVVLVIGTYAYVRYK